MHPVLAAQETMPAIVKRMAKERPDTPFLHSVGGPSATWGQLQAMAVEWAARYIALGVQRGQVVVTFVDAGLDTLASWIALSSLGAIEAAANTEYRGRILAYAINNCRPSVVVAAQSYLHLLEAVASELQTVERVVVVGSDGSLPDSALPGVIRAADIKGDIAAARARMFVPEWHDIACITYTSGTTGPSKAVLLPWAQLNAINLGSFPFEDLRSDDIFYCTTAHAHFGSKSIPYLAAMAGGQVVVRSRFALNSFWRDITEYRVTTGMLVGTMADMLLRSPDSPAKTTLRNLFMAPLGRSYAEFSQRFGTRICTVYNSTEGGVAIRSDWNPTNPKTVGRLRTGYPGFEVRLVDEHDYDVPDGTPGECLIRSSVPWVMNAGYLNNPEATASA